MAEDIMLPANHIAFANNGPKVAPMQQLLVAPFLSASLTAVEQPQPAQAGMHMPGSGPATSAAVCTGNFRAAYTTCTISQNLNEKFELATLRAIQ
jgi:hypothetical protein